MIRTLIGAYWRNLRRDGLALMLTFVVPIAMFSVFAAVFGSMDDGSRRPVRIALLLEDEGDAARRLAQDLASRATLEVVELPRAAGRTAAETRVRDGDTAVAIVVPAGFSERLAPDAPDAAHIDVLADTSNPVAVEVVQGALHAAVLPLQTPAGAGRTQAGGARPGSAARSGGLSLDVVDVLGAPGKRPSIAFFAAGIGVMFLLFAVSGRSAILIEERENGVLLRLLTSRLSLPRLLLARWTYLLLLGVAQVTAMFVWGALVFGLDLFTPAHLLGFTVMTLATAAAAAAFALLLGVACRTRAQLSGIAVVLVLMMSALGGSMFPRFLMPASLQEIGRFTFNSWALDGYRKVFWYEAPLSALRPELLVLGATTLVFFFASGLLARRWRHA